MLIVTTNAIPAASDAAAMEGWAEPRVLVVLPASGWTEAELTAIVRQHLAAYKAPKHILFVAKVPRAPNGKADYVAAKALAASTAPQA
mgnify:CR=1 FL=1